ncbi:MAG: hypothetical protein ACTSUQ_11210 [Candidatus Freyarchaeota archaeon]
MSGKEPCLIENPPRIFRVLEKHLVNEYKQVLLVVALTLSRYYRQRFFTYEEAQHVMEGVISVCGLPAGYTKEDIMSDVFLLGEEWNAFYQEGGTKSDCLAWENRLNLPSPGERYEIPRIISLGVRKLEEEHKQETWQELVKEHFWEIGALYGEKIPLVLRYAVERGVCGMVNASSLEEGCLRVGLNNTGAIIAELKGSGIISPSVHFGVFLKKPEIFGAKHEDNKLMREFLKGAPIYQLNKAFVTWFSSGSVINFKTGRCPP